MTLAYIQALIVSVDENAGHYESEHRDGEPFTVWRETGPLNDMGDNAHMGGIAFTVDRFSKTENDEIAAALFAALDQNDLIAVAKKIFYDPDSGYIHHTFECEGA